MLLQPGPAGLVVQFGRLIVERSQLAVVLQDDIDKLFVGRPLRPPLLLDRELPLAAVVVGGVAGKLMPNPQTRLHRLHATGAVVQPAGDPRQPGQRVGIEKFVDCLHRFGERRIAPAGRDDLERRGPDRDAGVGRRQPVGQGGQVAVPLVVGQQGRVCGRSGHGEVGARVCLPLPRRLRPEQRLLGRFARV